MFSTNKLLLDKFLMVPFSTISYCPRILHPASLISTKSMKVREDILFQTFSTMDHKRMFSTNKLWLETFLLAPFLTISYCPQIQHPASLISTKSTKIRKIMLFWTKQCTSTSQTV